MSDRLDTGEAQGALRILRRGVDASPELRRGLGATVVMGIAIAIGRLLIPVLLQQVIDRGLLSDGGVDRGLVLRLGAIAVVLLLATAALGWVAQRRLVLRAEQAIAGLRIRAFARVHRLSIADQNDSRRGVLIARVTSDIEALARFAQWGLYAWSVNPILVIGIVVVMAWYSPVLAALALLWHLPVIPIMSRIQRHQLAAHDETRDRAGDMLTHFSESLSGAPVLRTYGAEARASTRLHDAIDRRYAARIRANFFHAWVFVVGDLFGGIALVAVALVGVVWGPDLGLEAGGLVACLFLVGLMQQPIGEMGETMDQTQAAVSGWRKVLDLLDLPDDVPEPVPGLPAVPGPVGIEVDHLSFRYRTGDLVLRDVDVTIPAGTAVAVVGETGSGKSTLAKLLCRLVDPTEGDVRLSGRSVRELSPEARSAMVRMVPQDGFLFDTTVGTNVAYGRAGADRADVEDAFRRLDLWDWVSALPDGLDTEVGERGTNLSVGERQLVALARVALADPGLLILDEATSSVDPETDLALTRAIGRLAADRTVVSIAHRLATAESADLVLVFDQGRLVERGHHRDLVSAGGIYGRLYEAWIGNTRADRPEGVG